MMIANSMLDLVGHTPMVRLNKVVPVGGAEVLVKLECWNPGGSIKDRAAYQMLLEAERKGRLHSDTLLVEPTSGNTGIGLAFVCAVRGWRLILVMPESMSLERRKLLAGMGAELVLTPASGGMAASVAEAERIVQANENAILVGQFDNPANPRAHEVGTAPEIFEDCDGKVDAFIAGAGSGGTVSGVGRELKRRCPSVHIVAMEPAESPLLSAGKAGAHGIQGIGANFIPGNYDASVVDEVVTVSTADALAMARRLMREEGISCGISSGANVAAAVKLASRPEYAGKRIVTVIVDAADRYLSTDLFKE